MSRCDAAPLQGGESAEEEPPPLRLNFQGTAGGARALGQLSDRWQLVLPLDAEGGKRPWPAAARCAWALALAGVAVLVVAGFVHASGRGEQEPEPGWWDREPSCSFASGPCPAQQLLESRDVCHAVAKNVVTLCRLAGENISKRTALAAAVHVFGTLSAKLRRHAPGLARKLRAVEMSREESQAILEMLTLISDHKVQGVGRIVAEAIGDRGSMHRGAMAQRIRRRLTPAWDNIRVIRNQAVPGPLRSLWGDGDPELVLWQNRSHRLWEMSLEESNVYSVRRGGEMEAAEAALAASRGAEFAVFAAALVQGRAVLDMLQMYVRARGRGAQSDLGRALEFAFGALSWPCCVDPLPRDGVGMMQEVVCPLKFGAMGMDALRATFVDDASTALHEHGATDVRQSAFRQPATDVRQ